MRPGADVLTWDPVYSHAGTHGFSAYSKAPRNRQGVFRHPNRSETTNQVLMASAGREKAPGHYSGASHLNFHWIERRPIGGVIRGYLHTALNASHGHTLVVRVQNSPDRQV